MRTIENLEEKGAERAQRIGTLESQIQAMQEQISAQLTQINTVSSQVQTTQSEIGAASSRINTVTSRVQTVQSQIGSLSSRVNTVSSQLQTAQSRINALTAMRRVTRCRLCFREIEGSSQCQRSRSSCSGWSTSPSWTSPFRDDTDGRSGGCTYQWRIECA